MDVLLETPSFQELHDNERLAFMLTNVVDGADVGVVQRRSGACLAEVPVDGIGVPGLGLGHELQGDMAVESGVLGSPDDSHATRADPLDQAVVQYVLSDLDGEASCG